MGVKEFYSVQEFARLAGVEASTLRYWDDIGLFTPSRRNEDNNYRYYSIDQIFTLNFIRTLSQLKIPLKTISELRQDRDPERFLRLLDKQEKTLDMEMREIRLRYSIIHARRELINYGIKVDDRQIAVMHRDDKPLMLLPANKYKEGDTFIEPLTEFFNNSTKYHVNLSFPIGGFHNNIDRFLKTPSKPDRFFTIDPIGTHTRKEGDYLVAFARGPYGKFGDLAERLTVYIEEHSLKLTGPVYTMYLLNEVTAKDPDNYLAQVCVAVSA